MMIHMDDHKGKHSAKNLRIDVQRSADNTPVGGIEHKLLLFLVSYFFSLLSLKNKKNRSESSKLDTINRLEG
jgi:hypothetical protein